MGKKGDILSLVGGNIRKMRMSQKMSQNQLAFEAGITREFVNKLESGNYNVSVNTLEKMAEILGVEVRDLFNL